MSISNHITGRFTKKSGPSSKTLKSPGTIDARFLQTSAPSTGSSGGLLETTPEKYLQSKKGSKGDKGKDDSGYSKYLAMLGDFALKYGYKQITDKDGKTDFKNDKGESMKDNQNVMSDAYGHAAMVGLSELLKGYANDGSISEKEYMKAGGLAAIDLGKNWASQQDWGKTVGGKAGTSGAASAAGSALAQYIDKGEVDWGDVAWAGGKSAAMSGFKGSAASNPAGAMGLALLMEGAEHKMSADDMRLSDGMGAMLGAVGGPLGGMAGAVIGEAIQGGPDTFHLGVFKDESRPPIWVDENGRVQVNDMVGVMKGYSNVDEVDGVIYHKFQDPTEEAEVYKTQREIQFKLAQDWQDKIDNYENLSIADQFMVDQFKETGEIPARDHGAFAVSSIDGRKNKDGKYTTTNAKAGEFKWDKSDYNVADMGEMRTLDQINKEKESDYLSYSTNPETSVQDEKRRDEEQLKEQKKMAEYYAKKANSGALTQQQQEFLDTFNQPEPEKKGLLEDDGGVGAYSPTDGLTPLKQTSNQPVTGGSGFTNPLESGVTGTVKTPPSNIGSHIASKTSDPYANYDMEGI